MAKLLVCDLDGTLLGDAQAMRVLLDLLQAPEAPVLAFATGRAGYSAIALLSDSAVNQGSYLIAGVGSELYRRIGKRWMPMACWPEIRHPWDPDCVRGELVLLPDVRPQPQRASSAYKLSYFASPQAVRAVRERLREAQVHASIVHSHGDMLDVLPDGIDKGAAVRWLAKHLGIPLDCVATCGNTANDLAMLRLPCASIVVGQADEELLAAAPSLPNTYLAQAPCAAGIIEGLTGLGWMSGSQWAR